MEWRFKKEKEKRKKKMEKNIAQVAFNQKQISQEKQENASVLAIGGYGKYSWFEISFNLSPPKTYNQGQKC